MAVVQNTAFASQRTSTGCSCITQALESSASKPRTNNPQEDYPGFLKRGRGNQSSAHVHTHHVYKHTHHMHKHACTHAAHTHHTHKRACTHTRATHIPHMHTNTHTMYSMYIHNHTLIMILALAKSTKQQKKLMLCYF